MAIKHQHFLITALPSQSHINPALQLAKNLARAGAQVTLATTEYGFSRIKSLPSANGLSFASFTDGHDEESRKKRDFVGFLSDLKHFGSRDLTKLIQTSSHEGRPVTFLIYTVMLPWVAEVAREMHISSAFLAIQCATSFAIYHRYFNNQDSIYDRVRQGDQNTSISIKLPDLSLFEKGDLPSFLFPTDIFFAPTAPFFHEHFKVLEQDSKPCVLVNTFDELEEASIRAVDGMNVIPIGPLIPSAFADGNDPADISFGGNLFDIPEKDCIQWLDSKPEKSVVYVSFGSFVALKKEEKVEILHGLKEAGRPYLMVIRFSDDEEKEVKAVIENISSEEGIMVPWCSQMEVLCHRSIGCFITHCGWNSTLESLAAGVPIVGCPKLSDQTTNAKLIEEVWGIGVRAKASEEGVVERGEIKRCLDIVMGGEEKGEEIRRNAAKWRDLAVQAVKENGSSHNNFRNFLQNLE